METELKRRLPFLDIDIHRRPYSSLGHSVYRKSTHTNLYLTVDSHHQPANKHSALLTLVHRARDICNQKSLPGELNSVKVCSNRMATVIAKYVSPPTLQGGYTQGRTDISGLLNLCGTYLQPHQQDASFFQPVKDNLGLKTKHPLRVWEDMYWTNWVFH